MNDASKTVTSETPEFKNWLAGCQKIVREYFENKFPGTSVPTLRVEWGNKYAQIFSGGNCYAFIALVDSTSASMGTVKAGDVLKTASRKKPAKHARGNLFDAQGGLGSMGAFGAAYLK